MYICQNCGAESSKWMGRCSSCNEWNTLSEVADDFTAKKGKRKSRTMRSVAVSGILDSGEERIKTEISELDRVLGGGLVKDGVILIGGAPGIGKSTLLMDICLKLAEKGERALYFSAEESVSQVSSRARRIGGNNSALDTISLVSSTDLEELISLVLTKEYPVIILDSIQAVSDKASAGFPGGISQVRDAAYRLTEACKKTGVALIMVSHITKAGSIAGPMVLFHIVDSVLIMEGDSVHDVRILRCIKNRFGNTNEVGVFRMEENGIVPVSDISDMFISDVGDEVSGVARGVALEGIRPMIVDVQALVVKNSYSMPRRVVSGFDSVRVQMLVAVISKTLKVDLSGYDIFVNVTGGLKSKDSSLDLPVCAAIVSSFRDVPIKPGSAFIGEVGLSGEVRTVARQNIREKECNNFGIKNIYSSQKGQRPALSIRDVITKSIGNQKSSANKRAKQMG